MRERITFVHPPQAGVDLDIPDIDDAGIRGPVLESVREDKITLPLDRLPSQLSAALQSYPSLRLRWTSPLSHDTVEPFAARLSPGFHLSYVPRPDGVHDAFVNLYLLNIEVVILTISQCRFVLPGSSFCCAVKAFTRLDASEPSTSSAYYYYQQLENLHTFTQSISEQVCEASDSTCHERLQTLHNAASLDISVTSVDGTPQALELKALWPLSTRQVSVPSAPDRRTEVGLLTRGTPPSQRQHEVGLEGALVVLGQQSQLSPTAFAFPARHRLSDALFSAEFLSPTGLHPTLQLTLSSNHAPSQDTQCAPHVYLTLPRTIFADRYQLADDLFLASKNLTATRYTTAPVDLEAPAYTMKPWGSNVLLELAAPQSDKSTSWTAELPLHLRYLEPSETGYAELELPYPVVFWACSTGETGWNRNPFDRPELGYDNLFDEDTVFWHVAPKPISGGRLTNIITVPVLQSGGSSWIALGTAAVVMLGFTWVLWQLFAIYWKSGSKKPSNPSSSDKRK
ncbi:Protein PBN1 [Paramyrothecium foliicola]|nr:Protein PBN1 [Paramyrothecium foliicola]